MKIIKISIICILFLQNLVLAKTINTTDDFSKKDLTLSNMAKKSY